MKHLITPAIVTGGDPLNRYQPDAYDQYTEYMADEDKSEDGIGIEGCYWCGGMHPSEGCPSGEQRIYWDQFGTSGEA